MKQLKKFVAQIREAWIKYHWPILASLGFLSTAVELLKYIRDPSYIEDPIRALELVLQGIVLPVLLLNLQRIENQRNTALQILTLRDALVYQLNQTDNWDEIFKSISQFTRNMIPLSGICLLLQAPNSNKFDFEFVRVFDNDLQIMDAPNAIGLNDTECCCNGITPNVMLKPCHCSLKLQVEANKALYQRYCLPLFAADAVLGVLHLYLPGTYGLSESQISLFAGIQPAVSISISNANLKRTNALREAAVEAERLRLASDLHDTLGQDLAYLQNKIHQYVQSDAPGVTISKDELNQMQVVAEGANRTVRNILSITHASHEDQIDEWLLDYSKTISERAGFNVALESHGHSQTLSPHVLYQIFLIFREALANIEKHAAARNVTIALTWSENELIIAINDDGRGFLTDDLDLRDHFGLTIMETRTRELNGHLAVISAPNKGTRITVQMPIEHASLMNTEVATKP